MKILRNKISKDGILGLGTAGVVGGEAREEISVGFFSYYTSHKITLISNY